MKTCYITGPTSLSGEVKISGSKNAALPILLTSILTKESIELYNVPILQDTINIIKILSKLGVKIKVGKEMYLNAGQIRNCAISNHMTKKTRASIWILGPLLARFGYAKISFPGGCNIGKRKIDLHIFGLKKLGATIKICKNHIIGVVVGKLKGANITLSKISVGATVTIMSTATLALGITTISNAAREPEIIDVANFLNNLGAKIIGAGSHKIIIKGVNKLHGGTYKIIPDRIETGTFLIAAAISQGNIICYNSKPKMLTCLLKKLTKTGARIRTGNDWVSLNMSNINPKAINIVTSPYPGFPTDMQAQFTLLNLVATGNSKVTETIFENRFIHIPELIKMGALAIVKKNSVFCYGVKKLHSAKIIASDLRGSSSLILAGCIANGNTIVKNSNFVTRGYENFYSKLKIIGAKIKNK
ncbi:UDP-N-acetylglucosamine 1-carboxyvinyltransferase [Buchnera aphidicola (Schlechtendalia chinensis)]|uniref:UDP-N-acetylglucosamine 1-carboxyvinyltransferase n=1 Tax=Buchnera aphidicola subsp. Schlechtendalia chinensis TaxID=118110 RepID=A0A172WDT6_BUCSC|nr:UDP-N-acetylglucosamine 1-carboxyvinyltransferase [Buchnera aphidicola]ANF17121.1 UDP-N-acetylglucosamine 1-carboxyvinyltransferase [Buchnera aphidicola (Schlechtendalia chinensis)]